MSGASVAEPPMWQIRQVLETLSMRGDLVFPKTVDGDDKKVLSLLVAMSIDGLVTWCEVSSEWVFKISDEGRAALAAPRLPMRLAGRMRAPRRAQQREFTCPPV
jgi:hypothetical protein